MPDERPTPTRSPDPLLLLEVGLVLLLLALFIVFFWVPAAEQPFRPVWWAWPTLAAVLFGLLTVDRARRRRGRQRALDEALREVERLVRPGDPPPPAGQ